MRVLKHGRIGIKLNQRLCRIISKQLDQGGIYRLEGAGIIEAKDAIGSIINEGTILGFRSREIQMGSIYFFRSFCQCVYQLQAVADAVGLQNSIGYGEQADQRNALAAPPQHRPVWSDGLAKNAEGVQV